MKLPPSRWKADFPVFQAHPDLRYLDAAATSQRPQVVLDALREFHVQRNANVHRGLYAIAEEATAAYEGARAEVARLLNAAAPEEVLFTSGATMGMNLLAQTWGRAHLRAGDEVLLSPLEHHAVVVPWTELARELGVTVAVAPLARDGSLDTEQVVRHLRPRTKLVLLTAMSNVLGVEPDVAAIGGHAHRMGARVFVDAAQAAAHRALDVQHLPIDALVLSGHKACGDFGTGVLWARDTLLRELPPFLRGGEMVRRVAWDGIEYLPAPARFEAGTPNVAGAVALATGLRYLAQARADGAEAHERALTEELLLRLAAFSDATVLGPTDPAARGPIVSFTVRNVHAHDVAQTLDEYGIAVRAGQHCAQPLHDALGVPASVRASFGVWNDVSDVDEVLVGLMNAKLLLER